MDTKNNEGVDKTTVVIDIDKVNGNQENPEEKKKEKKVKPKKELSPADIKKRNKFIAIPIMVMIFCGAMYFIFSMSSGDKAKQKKETVGGFNADIPQPKDDGLIADKKKAYEIDLLTNKQKERMQTLDELSVELSDAKSETTGLSTDLSQTAQTQKPSQIQNSANAYRDMNRELSSFYQPSNDAKNRELEEKIEKLSARLEQPEAEKSANEKQLEMMEKSYQMASKYITPMVNAENAEQTETSSNSNPVAKSKKSNAASVSTVKEKTVSGLQQIVTDSAFIAQYSKPRNMGFNTAIGNGVQLSKNTIKACVHENQTLVSGQTVRLRLLEPLLAGKFIIPQNSLVSGMASLQGERLNVSVTGIEYEGNIIPVELLVYDTDGLSGINIPGSMELNAVKEAAANIGAGMGTSISFAQSAGQQIAMDLTRGVMQSGSQYLSKKFREVKVNLKAGYEVMLFSKQE